MRRPIRSRRLLKEQSLLSFTLVELLVVMAIIAILMGLILVAGNGVIARSIRARASAEIQAMSAGLESYKTDNGIYPPSDGSLLISSSYATADPTSTTYQTNGAILFSSLTGYSYLTAPTVAGTKSYMTFKANQVGVPAGPYSYVKDPWGNSYGYSTATNGTTVNPYNGAGFFDLWSTGGQKASGNTNAWISNWQ